VNYTRKDFPTTMTHPQSTPSSLTIIPPLTATGPLGLCYHCVTARKTDPARHVAEAITLAPVAVQIGDALGNVVGVQMVPVPHCIACLGGTGSRLITS
jgi:hypothetical protein